MSYCCSFSQCDVHETISSNEEDNAKLVEYGVEPIWSGCQAKTLIIVIIYIIIIVIWL